MGSRSMAAWSEHWRPFEMVAFELRLHAKESIVGISRRGGYGKSRVKGPDTGRSLLASRIGGKPLGRLEDWTRLP